MATVKANGYIHIPAQVEGYEACQELDACLTTDPGSIERTLLLSGSLDPALEELGDLARKGGSSSARAMSETWVPSSP